MTHELDIQFAAVADQLMDFGGATMVIRHQDYIYDPDEGGMVPDGDPVDTTVRVSRDSYSDLLIMQGLVDMSDIRLWVVGDLVPEENDTVLFDGSVSGDTGRIVSVKPVYAVNEIIMWDCRVVAGGTP